MLLGYITFFTFLVFVTKVYLKECQPVVTVTEGSMIGKRFMTYNRTAFYAFLDIPYAIPPVEKLRFQETRPIKIWNTRLDATENRKVCIQFDPTFDDPRATEDCLVLNVYVPEEQFCDRKKDPLSVLLWIHGGSFRSWFGTMDTFGPQYFIDQNIIVVSINYRLGPLGFLSTVDDVIPGNLGIKDQQLAIKWVSKRIKHFGGDPSRITLMGQSAGAMSVGYHLMNPQNKGLFNGAIMQSGSPLSCAALQKFPRDAAFSMAAEINERFKNVTSSQDLLTLLQETPVDVLKSASFVKIPTTKLNCQFVGSLTWIPTRESPEGKRPIITGMNYEKVKKGLTLNVPLLIGITSQESVYYGTDGLDLLAKIYDINPSYLISGNLNINHKQRCAAGQALKYIYTNSSFSSDISKLIEFNSDAYFNVPTLTFAYYHAQHSDVYAYRFAFKGMLGNLNNTLPGVGHAEDLNYFFQNSENANLSKYSNDEITAHNRVVELWSQFIKYRNPTMHTNDLLQNVQWPKFTQNEFVHLNIDENLSVGHFESTFKEWINIIARFARPLIDTF